MEPEGLSGRANHPHPKKDAAQEFLWCDTQGVALGIENADVEKKTIKCLTWIGLM